MALEATSPEKFSQHFPSLLCSCERQKSLSAMSLHCQEQLLSDGGWGGENLGQWKTSEWGLQCRLIVCLQPRGRDTQQRQTCNRGLHQEQPVKPENKITVHPGESCWELDLRTGTGRKAFCQKLLFPPRSGPKNVLEINKNRFMLAMFVRCALRGVGLVLVCDPECESLFPVMACPESHGNHSLFACITRAIFARSMNNSRDYIRVANGDFDPYSRE